MNQPPQTTKQMGRRIVSKGEYATLMGRRIALSALGCLMVSTAWVVGVADILLVLAILVMWSQWAKDFGTNTSLIVFMLSTCFVMVGPLLFLYHRGKHLVHKIDSMERIVPLTRANTVHLPAPDSLVRASSEPAQEQQDVLLRAAAESVERHEDQLVRPSAAGTPVENTAGTYSAM